MNTVSLSTQSNLKSPTALCNTGEEKKTGKKKKGSPPAKDRNVKSSSNTSEMSSVDISLHTISSSLSALLFVQIPRLLNYYASNLNAAKNETLKELHEMNENYKYVLFEDNPVKLYTPKLKNPLSKTASISLALLKAPVYSLRATVFSPTTAPSNQSNLSQENTLSLAKKLASVWRERKYDSPVPLPEHLNLSSLIHKLFDKKVKSHEFFNRAHKAITSASAIKKPFCAIRYFNFRIATTTLKEHSWGAPFSKETVVYGALGFLCGGVLYFTTTKHLRSLSKRISSWIP